MLSHQLQSAINALARALETPTATTALYGFDALSWLGKSRDDLERIVVGLRACEDAAFVAVVDDPMAGAPGEDE